MSDDDPDDDGFDANFAAIADIKSKPAEPADTRKTIGGDTPRTPEEVRASPGYRWIADWFARGEAARAAAREPQTIEERFYGAKK